MLAVSLPFSISSTGVQAIKPGKYSDASSETSGKKRTGRTHWRGVGLGGLALNDQMLLPKRLPLAAGADVAVIDSDAIARAAAAAGKMPMLKNACAVAQERNSIALNS
jgi:hypothetical protein